MYANFEVILEAIQDPNPDREERYVKKVNQRIPSGWCVYRKFTYGEGDD